MTQGPGDTNGALVEERWVLTKYEGELSYEDIASGEHEPVETIVIVNDEVVERTVKEDN